ncbi:hypothetical protein [Caballeronia hypogeia]|uniref:hypothetical protein n=1 Tax=Caballeronia hypogeia TaxID=1777140 RepID=UPI0012FD7C8C|nr:hypothetical protein [Caballeronia hypogeia]
MADSLSASENRRGYHAQNGQRAERSDALQGFAAARHVSIGAFCAGFLHGVSCFFVIWGLHYIAFLTIEMQKYSHGKH